VTLLKKYFFLSLYCFISYSLSMSEQYFDKSIVDLKFILKITLTIRIYLLKPPTYSHFDKILDPLFILLYFFLIRNFIIILQQSFLQFVKNYLLLFSPFLHFLSQFILEHHCRKRQSPLRKVLFMPQFPNESLHENIILFFNYVVLVLFDQQQYLSDSVLFS